MYPNFKQDILKFNSMYKLQPIDASTEQALGAISNFEDIISEEAMEGLELVMKYSDEWESAQADGLERPSDAVLLALKTDLADWLGDLTIYCFTFAARWGIPMDQVIAAIMQSNFTKLGADGQPLYDARGKVCKGPHFQPPEPAISRILANASAAEVRDDKRI